MVRLALVSLAICTALHGALWSDLPLTEVNEITEDFVKKDFAALHVPSRSSRRNAEGIGALVARRGETRIAGTSATAQATRPLKAAVDEFLLERLSFVGPRRHEGLRITAEQFTRFAGEESAVGEVKTATVSAWLKSKGAILFSRGAPPNRDAGLRTIP